MKAVVFHGIGDIRLDDVKEPKIKDSTDAIVRLTASASQILTITTTINCRIWERAVIKQLHYQPYALLISEQLVGICLMVFVQQSLLLDIRSVETIVKKTGFGGMTGNKGAVVLHMDINDTSICCVGAHFASGVTNFLERNQDYHTIMNDILFSNGLQINDHNYIIWLGDFNYRIDLPNNEVRSMINKQQIESLFLYDQLSYQMHLGEVFADYKEGSIDFKPTYKYDVGTDTYDTSEKQRVPSWTDRILFRGRKATLLKYYCEEISFRSPARYCFTRCRSHYH